MLNNYQITFTQDRRNYKSYVIPAETLVDAYIFIQDRFPGAEITEAIKSNQSGRRWAEIMAEYIIHHATLSEVCEFACTLNEAKHDEFINALWDEWHKIDKAKAVQNGI